VKRCTFVAAVCLPVSQQRKVCEWRSVSSELWTTAPARSAETTCRISGGESFQFRFHMPFHRYWTTRKSTAAKRLHGLRSLPYNDRLCFLGLPQFRIATPTVRPNILL